MGLEVQRSALSGASVTATRGVQVGGGRVEVEVERGGARLGGGCNQQVLAGVADAQCRAHGKSIEIPGNAECACGGGGRWESKVRTM